MVSHSVGHIEPLYIVNKHQKIFTQKSLFVHPQVPSILSSKYFNKVYTLNFVTLCLSILIVFMRLFKHEYKNIAKMFFIFFSGYGRITCNFFKIKVFSSILISSKFPFQAFLFKIEFMQGSFDSILFLQFHVASVQSYSPKSCWTHRHNSLVCQIGNIFCPGNPNSCKREGNNGIICSQSIHLFYYCEPMFMKIAFFLCFSQLLLSGLNSSPSSLMLVIQPVR